MARNFRELQDKMSPESRARVEERVKASLAAMDHFREARDLTQTQLAIILEVSPDAIAEQERRADIYLSTLRSYVQAMGGELEIRAVFPTGESTIGQFSDLAQDQSAAPELVHEEESMLSA
jgi:DNA-binding XRE family transcriptional regulator